MVITRPYSPASNSRRAFTTGVAVSLTDSGAGVARSLLKIRGTTKSNAVMPGLDPGIHEKRSLRQDVDPRVKPGGDEGRDQINFQEIVEILIHSRTQVPNRAQSKRSSPDRL